MKEHREKISIVAVPNPEVKQPVPRATRRAHTAEYKLKILREADQCQNQPGGLSAILRREGLYSTAIVSWRKQRESGSLSSLSEKRGRKPKYSPIELQCQALLKEKAFLQERLRQSNLIIEAQKKIAEILGNPIPTSTGMMS